MKLQRVNVADGNRSADGGGPENDDAIGSGSVAVAASPLRVAAGRAKVVLGIHDVRLHQEVMDRFERDPRIEVSVATTEAETLAARVREHRR